MDDSPDDLFHEAPPSKRARIEDEMSASTAPLSDAFPASTTSTTHDSIAFSSTGSMVPGLEATQSNPKTNDPSSATIPDTASPAIDSANLATELPDNTQHDVAMEDEDDEAPAFTKALEAMLGGLGPEPADVVITVQDPTITTPGSGQSEEIATETLLSDIDATKKPSADVEQPVEDEDMPSLIVQGTDPAQREHDFHATIATAQEPQLLEPAASQNGVIPESALLDVNTEMLESQDPEFEADSSPIESSSDDSSDSSVADSDDDEEDSEADEAYQMLSVEEQARILMEGDGASDDEGGGKSKGPGTQLRTKNEIPEEVIPKPDVTITPEMHIELLGEVQSVVDNMALINANTTGEYRVLESGSVLCLQDRSVIGVVAEILGRVQQPLYMVRFTNAADIAAAGLAVGIRVFYSVQHSTYVFTQPLRAIKGSDASNLHDEEVADEEMEFSDDEAELEHKRRLKQKRLEKRGGRQQQNGDSGRGHAQKEESLPYDSTAPLKYEEAEDDGPYKPLTRPTSFADNVARAEAPQEVYGQSRPQRGGREDHGFRGRGRGDRGRGRGDRGRGRGGDKGRGRGSHGAPEARGAREGYSQPSGGFQASAPTPNVQYPPPPPPPFNYQQPYASAQQYPQQPYQQSYPQQHFAAPPPPPPNFAHQWPVIPPPIPMPNGAYYNPAFFGQQQQPPYPQDPGVADLLKSLRGGRGRGG